MRYMYKKIYFNKFELQELEQRNPTLFELAQFKHAVDKVAHAHELRRYGRNPFFVVLDGGVRLALDDAQIGRYYGERGF